MEPTEETAPGTRRIPLGVGFGFAAIALMVGADLALDLRGGADFGHVLAEGAAAVLALWGAALSWRWWRAERARDQAAVLDASRHAVKWEDEARRWRHEAESAVKGLGEAIDRQFERWGLSPAEREVGMLLLKGLSHKEIAGVRGTSERTAREQARAVYAKAGLAGRAELSAFFLEDLLPGGSADAMRS